MDAQPSRSEQAYQAVSVWTLDPDPRAAARARRLASARLAAWQLLQLADDALLVITELVSNAVRFGRNVRVALRTVRTDRGTALRIEVTGPGPGPASTAPVLPGESAEHGRGLPIVGILADSWGVDRSGRGTRVWAELAPGAARPGQAASPE